MPRTNASERHRRRSRDSCAPDRARPPVTVVLPTLQSVAEPVGVWWARRQWSRGREVPYAVGEFREAWRSFPVLVRQYHPDRNSGIVLSQIPPAADVFLSWECDAGHVFVATPSEQRSRPGRERRRSSWCPECAAQARPRGPLTLLHPAVVPATGRGGVTGPASDAPRAPAPLATRPTRPTRRGRDVCTRTPDLPVGTPFRSACAPRPASAVEAQLRADLRARLEHTEGDNAVRLARPFFDHLEAWPDVVLPELRVAIEYDSTGRHGLEHVGRREDADRRKDRALRAAGWEVIRIRTGRLPALGPHDIEAGGWSRRTLARLVDELRAVRGDLLVDAYLRD